MGVCALCDAKRRVNSAPYGASGGARDGARSRLTADDSTQSRCNNTEDYISRIPCSTAAGENAIVYVHKEITYENRRYESDVTGVNAVIIRVPPTVPNETRKAELLPAINMRNAIHVT
ncbi:hypothetical protein GHT06_011822 [Daphnia sinensis]|uniref:Uncharacterized protein n=1 Tax=Daphnia sinensis TaxID=1820382 RepID=A0AAD5LN43_9CRUS|nr:hypothetical protein GHT06_011822 [Daphnia sinensis]